jgi:hypothetical protein
MSEPRVERLAAALHEPYKESAVMLDVAHRRATEHIQSVESAGLKVIVNPDVDALVEVAARALYEHDEASSCGAPDCVHAKWDSLAGSEKGFLQDQYRQDVRPVVLAVLAAVTG